MRFLTSIDVKSFNMEKVNRMDYMFSGAFSIKSLDLRSWTNLIVSYMYYTFSEMTSLEYLDIRNINLLNTSYTNNMFYKILDIENFTIVYNFSKKQSNIITQNNTHKKWEKIDCKNLI